MESNLYPFKLCYKFGNEPFKLYQRHMHKIVVGMETNTGSANVAIADASVPKLWSFVGYGLQEADMMKWVPLVHFLTMLVVRDLNAQKMVGNR